MRFSDKSLPKILNLTILAIILGLALYLRLDNLGSVQRFFGDQSRDYFTIMNWKQDGEWPLLGPFRVVQDRAIGPGWFYVIAPALWLTDFGPSAGAATVAVFSVAAIFLYWLWILRATGSALAALATAAVFAFSTPWVVSDRMLWNPQIMPFSVAALACLIQGLAYRPQPCLMLFLMLTAVLPHWHSSGVPALLIALPLAAWQAWRVRGRLREASRRSWLLWGLALLAVLVIHYLPPIIYEMQPGNPSNMRYYIQKTFLPAPPQSDSFARRMVTAADRVTRQVAKENFFLGLRPAQAAPFQAGAALAAVAFLIVYGRLWLKDRARTQLGLAFLALVVAGYWLIVVLKGSSVADYFLHAMAAAPVLLTGWTAGRLLREDTENRLVRQLARGAGAFIIVVGLTLTVLQLPAAWGIHRGRVSYGFSFRDSRQIAKAIARDARDKRFSLIAKDEMGNSPLYMHVLVRMAGARSVNSKGNSLLRPFPRQVLGDWVYIMIRGKMDETPRIEGGALKLAEPMRVRDARIYRIPVSSLPANLNTLWVASQPPHWTIEMTAR